jgi:sarcosine oxidase subunit delta
MRIHCPHCGPRGHDEFVHHGDVYLRDNPAGPYRELWFHAAGCHSWLIVERDTRTHEIRSVTFARGDA